MITEKFETLYKEKGIDAIIDYLKVNDPKSLVNHHQNDHYRLNRAALHFAMTGTPISLEKYSLDQLSPYDFSSIVHPWEILHFYLDLPKDQHFEIIKARTSKMFSDGLMNEIENLSKNGFTLNEKPLSSIGYKEAILLRNGQFQSESECIERIAISTRQLAKSQRTFFKKISPKLSFNPLSDLGEMIESVEQFLT